MNTDRQECQRCGASILSTTYDTTGGYCRPCYKRQNPPDVSTSPWFGDWQARVLLRIGQSGFDTPQAYFLANTAPSFSALADSLGSDVASVQLQRIHRDSAFPG